MHWQSKIILCAFFFSASCSQEHKFSEEKHLEICSEVSMEADSILSWKIGSIQTGTGSSTLNNITANPPYKVKLSYNDKKQSSFAIYKDENGNINEAPYIIETASGCYVYNKTDSLQNCNLKILTQGKWALVINEVDNSKVPTNQLKTRIDSLISHHIIDSVKIHNAIDSIILAKSTQFAKLDSIENFEQLESLTKEWIVVSTNKGLGNYETKYFNLPKCRIRLQAGAFPYSGKSVQANISLEGMGKSQSWSVLDAWYMSGQNWTTEVVEFEIPAGQYWVDVSCDGYWSYQLTALY